MIYKLIRFVIESARKSKFYFLSEKKYLKSIAVAPLLIMGKGQVQIHNTVKIGNRYSPNFYSGYSYIEPRDENVRIEIGEGTKINNGIKIIAYNANIIIGKNNLIGFNVEIISSDFHGKYTNDAWQKPKSENVEIGDNIFIGNNAKILKGVKIGNNSIISNGSIVYKDVPPFTIYK